MVHKSSLIPGFSKFIDENILSHYSPTSMKRILMAGAITLYLKNGQTLVDTLTNNPLVSVLNVVHNNDMIDLEVIRDTLKDQIKQVGFMRLSVPMIGDIDFTTDDVDALYKFIVEADTHRTSVNVPNVTAPTVSVSNGEVY
jgi:hypothetical protein